MYSCCLDALSHLCVPYPQAHIRVLSASIEWLSDTNPLLYFCSCFMSDRRIHYGLFLVPLFVMIIFNTISFILVIRVILKKQRKPQKQVARNMAKRIVVIFCLMSTFGIFWLLGAASVSQAAIFFEWPFIVLNIAQGIILFVYIVVIGAQNEWRNMLMCTDEKKTYFSNTAKGSNGVKKETSKSNTTKETSLIYANATLPTSSNVVKDIPLAFNKLSEKESGFLSDSGASDEAASIPMTEIADRNDIDTK